MEYKCRAIPVCILAEFLGVEIDKLILKFTWKCKRPTIAKAIQERRKEVGRFTLPDIKIYNVSIVINLVWYWHKDGQTDQWNRTV